MQTRGFVEKDPFFTFIAIVVDLLSHKPLQFDVIGFHCMSIATL